MVSEKISLADELKGFNIWSAFYRLKSIPVQSNNSRFSDTEGGHRVLQSTEQPDANMKISICSSQTLRQSIFQR